MAAKKFDLTNEVYHSDEKAREHLERLLWPDGPACPHCGNVDPTRITKLAGKSTRPGVYKCKECRKPFSVTVGTVMERSHVPLCKWVLAAQLMASSKKGMSALQLQRMIATNYETAWFMFHRLREAADDLKLGPIGGESKVVESDETVIGGKAKNRAYAKKEPKKHTVMALVERDGKSRSFHVANVKAKTLREKIVTTGHLEKLCFLVPRESDARFAGGKSGVFAMGQLGFFDVSRRYEG
ncbi:MAG: IS1595 family transposase, partial [Beijerinckiaceae bacterium]